MDHPLMISWMQAAHAMTNPHERPRVHVVRCVVEPRAEPSALALLRPIPLTVRVSPRALGTLAELSDVRAPARHAA